MTSFGQGFGGFGRRRGGGGGNMRWVIAAGIALFGIIGYFMKGKVTNPETGETYRVALDEKQQEALGIQAAEQMIPKMGGALDPGKDPNAALVEEVGRRLVRESNAAQNKFGDNFNFYLVNDPKSINAFALPGGQVSITRGLYERLENEAQLAGVLGHEIGHVIAEHSARQMAKGQLGQALATAVGVGSESQSGAMAAQMANQMLQLKYGREDERQSDDIGLKYMVQAGYDPKGMLGVMKILKEAGGGGRQPEFMSSHPHPDERLKTIEEFLARNKEQLAKMDLTQGRSLKGGVGPEGRTPKSDRGRLPKEQW